VDYFRAPNLEALSELAKAWVDGTLDEVGPELLARRGFVSEPPRRVVVAGISGPPQSEEVFVPDEGCCGRA